MAFSNISLPGNIIQMFLVADHINANLCRCQDSFFCDTCVESLELCLDDLKDELKRVLIADQNKFSLRAALHDESQAHPVLTTTRCIHCYLCADYR